MNFYPHFIGDYARDTADLSMLEHGAYRVLLDHYYASRGDMPAEPVKLNRICRAVTAADRRAVLTVADRFFPANGDGRRHNKRADEEIAKAKEFSDKQAMRAHKRWQSHGNATALPESYRKDANHNHHQEKELGETSSPPSESVHDCPHDQVLALYAKHLPMLTQPRIWEGRRAELLRARWRACSKRNEVWPGYTSVEGGLAFWDQFFSDVSKASKLTEGINGWKPDLPWLLKAENFAKVIEGRYHQ